MRMQIWCGTLALCVFAAGSVMAADSNDSVVVDLSVLDQLAPAAAPQLSNASNGPLFPIVAKRQVKKHIPAKKAPKKAEKAPAKMEVKVEVKQPAKIEVPATVPASAVIAEPQPLNLDRKIEPTAPVSGVEESPFKMQEPTLIDTVQNAPVEPVTSSQPESLFNPPAPAASTEIAAPTVSAAPLEPTAVVAPLPVAEDVVVVDVEPAAAPASIVPASVQADPAAADRPQVDHQLKYEADRDDLSAVQQIQIDKIIASFKDPNNNKIAIFSYNYDDGVDSFRKKRLSLNRAVEVRSYLLQKGYKNFSIKVVNVDSASGKANMVEIEEM